MKDERKSEAVNRLMDAITDLSDETVLGADEENRDKSVKEAGQEAVTSKNRIKRWTVTGISFAMVILVCIVAFNSLIKRGNDREQPTGMPQTEKISEESMTITEGGPTDAKATEELVTEAGPTEALVTENGPTEELATEAGSAEIKPTEASAIEDAEHKNIDSKVVSYESFSEMEKDADVILRVKRLDSERTVIDKDGSSFRSGYTLSRVWISRIYKDNSFGLAEEQAVTILENEVYDADENIIYHIAGYNMMTPGEEYLLFLKKGALQNNENCFVSCGVNYGTIALTENEREIRLAYLESAEKADISVLKDIWDEALKKYQ